MEDAADAETEFITIVHPAYPNRTQQRELRRQLDVVRGLYNRFLEESVADYIEGEPIPTLFEMQKDITVMRGDDALIRSVSVFTLRDAARRVSDTMRNFLRYSAMTDELHLPRTKSPSRYRTLAFDPRHLRFDSKRIVLSKELSIRCGNIHRPKGGRSVTVRVIRKSTGRWYIHVTYELTRVYREEENLEQPAESEAYDLGLCDIITDTHGEKIEAPDLYAKHEKEIAKLQRQISEMEDCPKRRKKQRQLARLQERIRRKRDGYLDAVANIMVEGHDVVVIEDLNVKKMKEREDTPCSRRKLFTEAALRILVNKVERKAARANIHIIKVDPAYTTRRCSNCGHDGGAIPLNVRVFDCPRCGLKMDRDRNAALNILGSGMGSLRPTQNRRVDA